MNLYSVSIVSLGIPLNVHTLGSVFEIVNHAGELSVVKRDVITSPSGSQKSVPSAKVYVYVIPEVASGKIVCYLAQFGAPGN